MYRKIHFTYCVVDQIGVFCLFMRFHQDVISFGVPSSFRCETNFFTNLAMLCIPVIDFLPLSAKGGESFPTKFPIKGSKHVTSCNVIVQYIYSCLKKTVHIAFSPPCIAFQAMQINNILQLIFFFRSMCIN